MAKAPRKGAGCVVALVAVLVALAAGPFFYSSPAPVPSMEQRPVRSAP
jgi:hypothetical protein